MSGNSFKASGIKESTKSIGQKIKDSWNNHRLLWIIALVAVGVVIIAAIVLGVVFGVKSKPKSTETFKTKNRKIERFEGDNTTGPRWNYVNSYIASVLGGSSNIGGYVPTDETPMTDDKEDITPTNPDDSTDTTNGTDDTNAADGVVDSGEQNAE